MEASSTEMFDLVRETAKQITADNGNSRFSTEDMNALPSLPDLISALEQCAGEIGCRNASLEQAIDILRKTAPIATAGSDDSAHTEDIVLKLEKTIKDNHALHNFLATQIKDLTGIKPVPAETACKDLLSTLRPDEADEGSYSLAVKDTHVRLSPSLWVKHLPEDEENKGKGSRTYYEAHLPLPKQSVNTSVLAA